MGQKTFDERKKKAMSLCEGLIGKEDETLLKVIYYIANYEDLFGEEGKQRIANSTYKECTNSELMDNFLRNKFCNLSGKQLTNLFQELHNRATVENGNLPRYVVSVKNIEEGMMGFMETYSNNLEISKKMINTFKNNPSTNTHSNNATTVGPMFANVLLHETQHTCQMENIIRYACGECQEGEDKSSACMSLMKAVVAQIACSEEDDTLQQYLEKNYWYDFDEHDANIFPIRYIKNMYQNGEIKDPVFADVMHSWTEDSLGFKVDYRKKSKVNDNFEERMDEMEKVANYCIEVFNKKIQDGALKNDIMKTLDDYMRVDENGDSPFRNRIRDDFNLCAQLFFNKQKFMNGNKKEEIVENTF